jgi:glycosyltransferase involved in cell wall biosynthesis
MQHYLYLKHFPPQGNRLDEGTTKAVHGLATGLAAIGQSVTVLCEWEQSSTVETPFGYRIQSFATAKPSSPSFSLSPELKAFVVRSPGLYALNGIFHPSLFMLGRWLTKHHRPYLVAPHDPYHPQIFRKNAHLKWPYWYLLERSLLNHSAAVQVLAKPHETWLRRLKIRVPVVVVPNGFEPEDCLDLSELTWGSPTSPLKLLCLGRMDAHHKGLDLLLRGLQQVEGIPWELLIQGRDAGDRAMLEGLVQALGLGSNVRFAGPTPASAVSVMAAHDILCLPSRYDGFGLVALEALLTGRQVLVSQEAGIAEVVQASGAGVVVEPRPEAIAAGLVQLHRQRPQAKPLGLLGRQYVLNHLGWPAIARSAIQQYQTLGKIGHYGDVTD